MKPEMQKSYVDLISAEYLSRKENNASYSLRAFSRHLEVTPAYLSMILRGKRHLSSKMALKISKRIGWSKSKQQYFLNLLEFTNPKNEDSKEVALGNLQKLESSNVDFHTIGVDKFEAISRWYYNAIISLLGILKTKATTKNIANKLNLDVVEVESALRRLCRLGLVESKNRHWIAKFEYLNVGSTPSDAIRIYHKQHLTKAATAIEEQGFSQRDFTNMTLAIDPSQIELAKKKIVEFHHEMAKILEGKKPSKVYQLSVQLFELTKPEE